MAHGCSSQGEDGAEQSPQERMAAYPVSVRPNRPQNNDAARIAPNDDPIPDD